MLKYNIEGRKLNDYQNYIVNKFRNTSGNQHEEVLEMASDFLILWSLYENYFYIQLSGERLNLNAIKIILRNRNLEVLEIDEIYSHFKKRYNDDITKVESLFFYDTDKYKPILINILNKAEETIDNLDKQLFLSIILYRYRNNMIHGSKGYSGWENYKSEIIKLTEFMYLWLKTYN